MNETELAQCHAVLGVPPGVTLEELERAFMKRNLALLKSNSGSAEAANPELEAQKQRLRTAYFKLAAHLRARQVQKEKEEREAREKLRKPRLGQRAAPPPPTSLPPMPPAASLSTPPVAKTHDPADKEFALFAFDNWKVNVFVPPLLLVLVWLANASPLGFLLKGFHVWMHEFGHATAAWLCGFRATPLPFGWTPVEPVYSPFVHWGLLLLFGGLLVAGVLERKVWPVIAAVLLALLQYYMTWRMPEHRQEFWWSAFGGVGGEFYLSTLFMMFFFVQLPEKFRWGACRYVFFLIGATAFLNIFLMWNKVYHGLEEIPFGTLINGEEDAGGDMNKLMDGYGWTKFQIRRTYHLLGNGCWVALGIMWALFALRLNRVADWVVGRFAKAKAAG
ncbi:MAG: M50 family metallopeptidase [Opitutae bacterium]|nr:M50 family metallopeptidase [Opitutae bacterium]